MFGAEGIPFFLSAADLGEKTFQPRRCSKFLNKIERISVFSASDQGFPPPVAESGLGAAPGLGFGVGVTGLGVGGVGFGAGAGFPPVTFSQVE